MVVGSVGLSPIVAVAESGLCRVQMSEPLYEIQSCSLTAGVDSLVVAGHVDPVYAVTSVLSESFAGAEVGATLEGPGVSVSWERGELVRDVIDVTAGEEYVLTLMLPGALVANSATSTDDNNFAAGMTKTDRFVATSINTETGRMGFCDFDLNLERVPPTGGNDPKIEYWAGFKCLEGPVYGAVSASLYKGTVVEPDAARGRIASESCDPPVCSPVTATVAKDEHGSCGSCYEHWTVGGGWLLEQPLTVVWLSYPAGCWVNAGDESTLRCKGSTTKYFHVPVVG